MRQFVFKKSNQYFTSKIGSLAFLDIREFHANYGLSDEISKEASDTAL